MVYLAFHIVRKHLKSGNGFLIRFHFLGVSSFWGLFYGLIVTPDDRKTGKHPKSRISTEWTCMCARHRRLYALKYSTFPSAILCDSFEHDAVEATSMSDESQEAALGKHHALECLSNPNCCRAILPKDWCILTKHFPRPQHCNTFMINEHIYFALEYHKSFIQ